MGSKDDQTEPELKFEVSLVLNRSQLSLTMLNYFVVYNVLVRGVYICNTRKKR